MTSITRTSLSLVALFALTLSLAAPGVAEARYKNKSGKNFTGENPLDVPRAEFQAAQEGMELIYQRKYGAAIDAFEAVGVELPDSPLGPLGTAIVYQAMMFENYDFSLDRVYLQESAEAQARFDRVARSRDKQAWNAFLLAVHQGINAMYHVRHDDYLAGFNQAWEALENVKKVERLAPEFHDVQLALGLYNYWRTAYTDQLDFLPKFGDHREEGLAQMRLARDKGLLAPAPASLALAYSYLEGKRYDDALKETMWTRERYPGSVLNEMTLARVYRSMKKYDDAVKTVKAAIAAAPDVKRLQWELGEALYKSRTANAEAIDAFKAYVESNPAKEYQAHSYYRMGLIERRQRHYDLAVGYLEKAVAAYPKFKSAATKLEQVKSERDARADDTRSRRAVPRKERPAKSEVLVPQKRTGSVHDTPADEGDTDPDEND